MPRTRFARKQSAFYRSLRSVAVRTCFAAILIPLLALLGMKGSQFLAHCHDDFGTHFHPVSKVLTALEHGANHGHTQAAGTPSADHSSSTGCEDDGTPADESVDGVLVSLPHSKTMPVRTLELAKAFGSTAVVVAVVVLRPPFDPAPHLCDPGGRSGGGSVAHTTVRAGERIIRTSRALLI